MPLRLHILDNADAVLDAALSALASRCGQGPIPVLLVPDAAAGDRARRALAAGPCALGARVETLSSWVGDRWELFGDGRRLVASTERALLMQRACAETERSALEATPGTVDLLASLAREALPYAIAPERSVRLSAAEGEALEVLGRYAALLEAKGLCEEAQAAALLPAAMEEVPPLVLAGFDELGCAHERLVSALASRGDVLRLGDGCCAPSSAPGRAAELQKLLARLYRPPADGPLEPRGAVRFLLPAGRYAAPPLVVRAVAQAVAAERERAQAAARRPLPVAVASRDARVLFDDVADALLVEGVSSAVSARRPFADTSFGRSFLALHSFACDPSCRAERASDFACGPFSGIGRQAACGLDAAWRGDRTVDRARIASDLAERSETARCALAAFARDDIDGALAGFESYVRARTDLDPAFRAEQLAAVACARAFASACEACGVRFADARALLERAPVPADARTARASEGEGPGEPPDVLFLSLDDAAARPSCSCAALALCDLSARAYPVRAEEDGGMLLLEKLGLGCRVDALAQARRRFFRALSCARDAVVCERALNTVDADEDYPAVMLEELIDCYRVVEEGPGASVVDRATGLPAPLAAFATTVGEDALHANLALACGASGGRGPSGSQSWDCPAAGTVSEAQRSRIVLPRAPRGGLSPDAPLALSPSALESYLECPYKWFALRRLRLSEPDAGFGPLEMGSFSHGVLKSFYERFRASGRVKVDAASLPEARDLLRETFERHLRFQPELKRNRNPLIPRTSFERAETAELERKLVAYLDREAALLPGFAPTHFEFEFGSDEPFAYAGCTLRGSVDRIDVDGQGRAVVIDYKGSLGPDYALDSSSPAAQAAGAALPHKVQSLVYAQVARKMLGLEVVGALYVSYGRDGRVAGAFDRTVVGERDIPGIDAEHCGVPGPAAEALGVASFGELVDAVEERIAEAVNTLASGAIAPGPRGADPCGYCPVLTCERRREA